MAKRTRIEGAIDAATGVLQDGLEAVRQTHAAVARKPFVSLGLVPGVADVAEVVRTVHDGITTGIYGGLRAGIAMLGAAARSATAVAGVEDREPRSGSAADLLVSAINGVAGDRLERGGNPLAARMELRRDGRGVEARRAALAEAFPDAGPRVALFVHGLSGNETTWSFYARRHYGDETTTYGTRLRADFGHVPLYVRYNSGLHISENGARLAALIDRLVSEWPVEIEEIVLVGHSMGGLVLRSACHYGALEAHAWVECVRHVFYLGSPHLGSPLEKFGNAAAWVMDRFDVTRPLARFVNKRSDAIKDLRFGAILDEHWQGANPDALLDDRTGGGTGVPLLDGAGHYFVAATVTQDPRHPLGLAIGDWLVRRASAHPERHWRHLRTPLGDGRHVGSMSHMQLLNHPEVYDRMRGWIGWEASAQEAGRARRKASRGASRKPRGRRARTTPEGRSG